MGDPRVGCRHARQGRCPLGPLADGPCPAADRRITDLATHPERHITILDLADYLAVHRKTVLKWIHAGTLPAYRFAGEWRIKTTDARTFVAAARFQPVGLGSPL